MKFMNYYTVQFYYNGKIGTYRNRTYHLYKPTMNLKDIAENIVEEILDNENLRVEGEIVSSIRLFGKEDELIWSSESKEEQP